MRICLLTPGPAAPTATAAVVRLADLLGVAHEVAVVEPAVEPSEEITALSFSCAAHRRSAAAMEAIREHYGGQGPDYLEVGDCEPLGFVALQARLGGDPLLARTLIGVRANPSAELRAVQDGVLSQSDHMRSAELERWQLREADRLIWPGGDLLGLYRRYYASIELPPETRIGLPPPAPVPVPERSQGRAGGPLRILFPGELRRSRGALDLLEACLSLSRDDWELTMAGTDTDTATMGQSVRASLEVMAAGDPRVCLRGALDPAELGRQLAAADLVALPARVEAFGEEGAMALQAGLPLLATPVGGHLELVADGETGWLSDDVGPWALAQVLERLLADPGQLTRVREGGAIAARADRLADPAPILAGYEALAREAATITPVLRPAELPLVTGVVPYYGSSKFVGEAVASLLEQTHPQVEVLIVNDGSFAAADSVLAELERDSRVTVVTQANAGEAAARNLGAAIARGEYVVMLDADNLLEPRFVERALAAFRTRPELAYVTCWLRMIDEAGGEMPPGHGYAPLGNGVSEDEGRNWDGDTLAMLPRRLFSELGFGYGPEGSMHADWELYRWLHREGRFGAVVPERLARYRVAAGSLLRGHGEELQERGWSEGRDRNRTRGVRWIANAPS